MLVSGFCLLPVSVRSASSPGTPSRFSHTSRFSRGIACCRAAMRMESSGRKFVSSADVTGTQVTEEEAIYQRRYPLQCEHG
jgi:hypothetical protein